MTAPLIITSTAGLWWETNHRMQRDKLTLYRVKQTAVKHAALSVLHIQSKCLYEEVEVLGISEENILLKKYAHPKHCTNFNSSFRENLTWVYDECIHWAAACQFMWKCRVLESSEEAFQTKTVLMTPDKQHQASATSTAYPSIFSSLSIW